MNRRDLIGAIGMVGTSLAISGRPALAQQGNGSLPNIVYILTDDMGYGDVRALNPESRIHTTHMDQLARQGMIFRDAHSGSAVCTPTRYGILTGRYCWRSRLKRGVLFGYDPHLIEKDRMTVASLLRQNGYHTACIGKWHLGWDWSKPDGHNVDFTQPVRNGPDANGFDYYYGHCGSLDMPPYVYVENGRVTAQPDRQTESTDKYGWWRKGPTGADFVHEEVLPNFTRRGGEYIKTRSATGKPFFLYLPLPAPHTPILPTKEFQGKSGTNPYGDFVLQVDASIGQIVQALEDSGVADDTLIIVTSDNGCSPEADFDVLSQFGHDPSHVFRGQKADIFEGGHRIPFIARWPRRIQPGTVCYDTTCLTDLMATAAEIVGVDLPEHAGEDSVSMLPNLLGTAKKPLREATVHHSINGSFSIRRGTWKLVLCPGSGGWSPPKPGHTQGLPPVQLYDLENDIGETKNVQDKHPELVKELRALLEKYKREGRSVRNGR
jgi:arylsulfatase A